MLSKLKGVVPLDWKLFAACRGKDPSLFIGSGLKGKPDPVAMKYCAACVVRARCLDDAVSYGHLQSPGVWGGTRETVRKELRRLAKTGCSEYRHGCRCRYCSKVAEILNPRSKVVASFSKNARHGFSSTHSKGCRCRACCHAAAFRSRNSKPLRKDRNTLVIVFDADLCSNHGVERCKACIYEKESAA